MSNLYSAFNAIAPMFLVIAVGYIARLRGILDETWLGHLNKVVFTVLLPMSLFKNIYTSDFKTVFMPKLFVFIIITTFVNYFAIFFIVPRFEKRVDVQGVMIQAMYRANFIIMGIPVVSALMGEDSLGATTTIIAFAVPVGNILAIITLQHFYGQEHNPKAVALKIVQNPLIVSIFVAFAVKLVHLELPVFVTKAVTNLASAATPIALLVLGGYFHFDNLKNRMKELVWCLSVKLVVAPAVMLTAAILSGFRNLELAIVLSYFAAPCGPTSFIMVKQMGGDAELAGSAVVTGCACSLFTLVIFSFILMQAGFIVVG